MLSSKPCARHKELQGSKVKLEVGFEKIRILKILRKQEDKSANKWIDVLIMYLEKRG
jgi:hypothetical protein